MNTPRDILLRRHAQAEAKLDTIRQEVVKTVAAPANESRELTFAATARRWFATSFRELVWRARWTWSGLAAAWVLILAVNHHLGADIRHLAAKSLPKNAEFFLTLREQQRAVAELIGQTDSQAVVAPKQKSPQPRSEAPGAWETI